jgi:formamidopyrimidine-DNA glycosylase
VVKGLRIFDPLLRVRGSPRLPRRTVVEVCRSGKQVLFGFSPAPASRGAVWLTVHLRMTGRLIWCDGAPLPNRSRPRARFTFDRGALLFHDTRRFGTFTWHHSRGAAEPRGIDPLSPALDGARFAGLISGSRQNVKVWLLRQDRLVGLGNIYASEILHAARVAPVRGTHSLGDDEIARLYRATRRILRRAIRNCGTTFSDFQDARGVTGSYQRYLAVYGREGEPCRHCGAPIRRSVQQQRSTFFCARCQT